MVVRIWAGLAAVVCGTVLATLPNGGIPMAAKIVLLIALLAALAATLAARTREKQHFSGVWDEPDEPPAKQRSDTQRSTVAERSRGSDLADPVGPHVITWLRAETFGRPWRDDYVQSIRRLVPADVRGDPVVDHLKRQLADAAEAFLRLYDENTVTDPLVIDGTWRMLPPDDHAGYSVHDEPTPVQAALIAAGTAVCTAYDALMATPTTETTMRR